MRSNYLITDIPVELFQRTAHNAWSNQMRTVALTIHLYGAKAYDYLRTIIPMPSPRTLRR
jgi:hypothetical protein